MQHRVVHTVNHPSVSAVRRVLPKVVLRERLYIPKALFTAEVRKAFSVLIPNYYPEYDEQTGEAIENRDLLVRGWKDHKNGWFSLSRGDLDTVWSVFRNCEIVDQRAVPKLSFDLQWLNVLMKDGSRSPLRDTQTAFIDDLMNNGFGIGEAPPRFGKTICMSNITCRVGMRTLVVVHQIELAKQFLRRFRSCTNIDEEEHRLGKRLVGICSKPSDFENLEICITTWQQFHAPLPKPDAEPVLALQQMRRRKAVALTVKKLRDRFGLVLVDEAHRAASACFSSVVNMFNPWYRFGVTATPDRKDQLDAVIKLIVGPVVTVADEVKIPIRVRHVYTGMPAKFTHWTTYEAEIARDNRRNKLALQLIEEDAKKGHSIVVVCKRTAHINLLVQALKV